MASPPEQQETLDETGVTPESRTVEEATRSSYESLPYSVNAFPQTHPDRLATIARLFGLNAPHPDRCRVLELGCASGGNLIPMALGAPQSRFVGIDLSGRQIADGQSVVRELELPNVELREASILDVGPDLGEFDYILAHGVFSWVPAQVQNKILDICHRHLSPQGVAYISYNTYPGWHARGALREMLWYHTARFTDPVERVQQARALLAFLARFMPHADGNYGRLVRQELMLLLVTPDSYLLHEHLDEVNEPLYFHQFAQRAAANALQYLGEAQLAMMSPARFGAQTETMLRHLSPDLLHMEQYMDFLRNRMFRQTLLCHAEAKLDHALRPESLRELFITSLAKPVQESGDEGDSQTFAGPGNQKLTTRDPLMKAAMNLLAESAPLGLHFQELVRAARSRSGQSASVGDGNAQQERQLATRLLNCSLSSLVDFSIAAPKFVVNISDRPMASPYARLRAREGGKVTNLRLETVPLEEPARQLLIHLDGRHNRQQLSDAVQQSPAVVSELLALFARSALLIG